MTMEEDYPIGFGDKTAEIPMQFPPAAQTPKPAHAQRPESEIRFPANGSTQSTAMLPEKPQQLSGDPAVRKLQIKQELQKYFPDDPVAVDVGLTQALQESHPHLQNMSRVARNKNNLFGIRSNGRYVAFTKWQDSVESYARTIRNNFPRVLGRKDFKTACWGLMHGGNGPGKGLRYAQDDRYLPKLAKMYRNQVEPMHNATMTKDPAFSDNGTPPALRKGQYHVLKGGTPIPGAERLAADDWRAGFPVTQRPRVEPARADAQYRPAPRRIKGPDAE